MPKVKDLDVSGKLRGGPILRNWPYVPDTLSATDMEDVGKCIVYDRVNEVWLSLGNVSTDLVTFRSFEGRTWIEGDTVASQTPNAGSGFSDLVGEFVYVGVTPGSSSTTKILRSGDMGDTWSSVTLGSSDTNGTNAINASTNIGYIATVTNAIYRSTSGATGTWSSVQALGNVYRNIAIRDDSIGVLALVGSTQSSTYYTSTNGTAWTSRTFPSGTIVRAVYSSLAGKFFVMSSNSILYSSTDGINWTSLRDFSSVFTGPTIANHLDVVGDQLIFGLETPYGSIICFSDGNFNYLDLECGTFAPAVPVDFHVARDRNSRPVQVMFSRFTTTKFHIASQRA